MMNAAGAQTLYTQYWNQANKLAADTNHLKRFEFHIRHAAMIGHSNVDISLPQEFWLSTQAALLNAGYECAYMESQKAVRVCW